MLTGLNSKKVVIGRGAAAAAAAAAADDTVADATGRRGDARRGLVGRIDGAVTGVHPSAAKAHQTQRCFLI